MSSGIGKMLSEQTDDVKRIDDANGYENSERITSIYNVFEISNVHNERNINLKFVILVRIRLNGFSGDCKSKK